MKIANYPSKDYAHLKLLGSLMTTQYLHPLIREKGGAYGAGCSVNESGLFSFFSYFDPRVEPTYENFEKSVTAMAEGKFSE